MNEQAQPYIARERVVMEEWAGDDPDARREAGEAPDRVVVVNTRYRPDGSVIPVKIFRLVADFTFEAEDIDDAFALLAAHFLHQSDEDEGEELDIRGEITIRPQEDY